MEEGFTQKSEKEKSAITPEEFKNQFLTRSVPEEYKPLISDVTLIKAGSAYAEHFQAQLIRINKSTGHFELTKLGELIAPKIKNGVVVDLGCGNAQPNHGFADYAGEKLFIGIDFEACLFSPGGDGSIKMDFLDFINPMDSLPERDEDEDESDDSNAVSEERRKQYEDKNPEPNCEGNAVLLKDDMLKMISQFPDESISVILASGIESEYSRSDVNSKYLTALSVEIRRTLKDNGIFVSYFSDVYGAGMDKISLINDRAGGGVFEKRDIQQ